MIPHQPPWAEVAWDWLGIKEWTGPGQSNPKITAMHASIDGQELPDDISWCSSGLNALFQEVGIKGTGSRAARSWLQWGTALVIPAAWCVSVLWRKAPDAWEGHVGLFLGYIEDDLLLWGCNQSNSISVARFDSGRLLGFRWPSEVA